MGSPQTHRASLVEAKSPRPRKSILKKSNLEKSRVSLGASTVNMEEGVTSSASQLRFSLENINIGSKR